MCASQTIYWDMSSSRRELALGAYGGCLVLSWNHSKSTPCLFLVRHKHRHTNHHAAASLAFKFVPAPLGVTHGASATRSATSTTAPPCPSPTRHERWTGRAVAYEAGFASRVVVVASSSVVRLGSTGISRKAGPTRKRSGPSRIATRGFPERSASGDLRTCLMAFPRCDAAAGRPGGHGQLSCLGRFSTTSGQASNHTQQGILACWACAVPVVIQIHAS